MGYRDEAGDALRTLLKWFQGAPTPHPQADFGGFPPPGATPGPRGPRVPVDPDADFAGLPVTDLPGTAAPSVLPRAAAGAAALGAAGLGAMAMRDGEPVVTSGGEADLAAEVPPLQVADDPAVAPAAKPAPSAPTSDRDRLRAGMAQQPMVLRPEVQRRQAADAILGQDAAARQAVRAAAARASQDQAAARRQAELQALEDEYNAERDSYDPTGRPRLVTTPLSDRAGGCTFRTRPDGSVEVVDNAPTEAESRADFQRWADQTPGSDRQAQYNPQGYAEWRAGVGEKISEDAQHELAISADPMAAKYRREAEKRQAESNISTRQKIYEARANPLDRNKITPEEQGRRDAVVRRAQARQNPLEYLGRGDDINDWQRMVVADSMLRNGAGPMTPLGVQAQQLHNIADVVKRAMTAVGPQLSAGMQAAQDITADAKARAANPHATGMQDLAQGNWRTEQAGAVIDAERKRHDTTWGGFSYDNERKLAETLQKPPYNLPPAEAEAAAYDSAERGRFIWNQGGGPAGQQRTPAPSPARPATVPDWTGG